MKRLIVALSALLALTACGTTYQAPSGVKVGKPYVIDGKTYYPEYDPHYDRTGKASWYGPGFHGNKTASGEKFNTNELTAAHPTLPMPSLVRVTNLENGETAIVRINDRGPFKDNRLIDLSKGAADKLGVVRTGLANVRVQYLKEETERFWAENNLKTEQIQFAKNDPYSPAKIGTRGGLDGRFVEPDSQPAQVVDAAPLEPVTTAELDPARAEITTASLDAPAPPQPVTLTRRKNFSLINDAQASDDPPAETPRETPRETQVAWAENDMGATSASDNDVMSDVDRPAEIRKKPQPKVVNLYSKEGKPVRHGEKSSTTSGDDAPRQVKSVSSSGGSWYIQAGSFSSADNARKLIGRIGSTGKAETSEVQVSGKTWHRVRVGPFTSREDANDALSQVEAAGANGARIVRE